jgi:ATP-dependent DNA ligase
MQKNEQELVDAIRGHDLDRAIQAVQSLIANQQPSLPGLEINSPLDNKVRSKLIDLFCLSLNIPKTRRGSLKEALDKCPDATRITKIMLDEGLDGLASVGPQIYLHVRPALATRFASAEDVLNKLKNKTWILEPKLDGEECQVHIGASGVMLMSSNGRAITNDFRETARTIEDLFRDRTAILEGEIVALDPKSETYLPRTSLRKKGVLQQIVIYDPLLVDGIDYTQQPSIVRSEQLKNIFQKLVSSSIVCTEQAITSDIDEFKAYYEYCIATRKLEGMIAKDSLAPYQVGSRTLSRVKIKPVDTIDAIVVGRNRESGSILISIRDEKLDKHMPIAWAVTNKLSEEQLSEISFFPAHAPLIVGGKTVDETVNDDLVVEVGGNRIMPSDRFESGWTLFGAVILCIRHDLDVERVTTLDEYLTITPVMGKESPIDEPTSGKKRPKENKLL